MKSISIYRASAILLFGILLIVALYYGRTFLIPFSFGILLAMLMVPLCRKLESWGFSRIPAILVCLFLLILLVAGAVLVISTQLGNFLNDLPQIQKKVQQLIDTVQQWVQSQFGVSPQKQIEFVKKGVGQAGSSTSKFIKSFIMATIGSFGTFGLVLIYMFFLLWKREKYEEFFLKLTNPVNHPEVKETLYQITKVSSEYLGGRLISMAALAIIYIIGFSIIGLKNAFLLALIAVIPTIIPYLGPLIGGFFPLAMALTSGSSGMFLSVVIVLVIAQMIDNYFIEPFVLGSNLSLSPFITIVSIVIGELIWGIGGMILFIPLTAIAKIVFDHVPRLHPFAFLLGDDEEGEPGWMDGIKKWVSNLRSKAS